MPVALSKQQYLATRIKARELYESKSPDGLAIKVPLQATVYTTENGSWVEAVVWVSKEKL